MNTKRTGETVGQSTVRVGSGPLGLLGVLFVGLKLTHYINWSWWWVTAPFWTPYAFLLGFLVTIFLIWAVARILLWFLEIPARRRRKARREALRAKRLR